MHELFKKRKTIRSFDPEKPIESEKIEEILNAADSAPSAGNLKARNVVVVSENEVKKSLMEASFEQKQIFEAPVVLFFVALPEKSAEKYRERGRELYAAQDATLAAGFAWLEAVNQGIASGWIGGFEEEKVRKVLGLSEKEIPVAILPLGYEK